MVNGVLRLVDLELKRREAERAVQDFLPLQETIEAARKAGVSVGDYVDNRHGTDGTHLTIERMTELNVFGRGIDRVCEIGPGSGRYLEKIIRLCTPSCYEIYETAGDWAEWLVKQYGVISQRCDGKTLADTPSQSIDLVQAHKVFVCVPFFTTCGYLKEMARVVRPGGAVVFDIFTENCMDDETVEKWFSAGVYSFNYDPSFMSKQYAIHFLSRRGLVFAGSFLVPLWPGLTECMVFFKGAAKA